MDLLNGAVLLKTKSTLFNLLIRKTLKFLCYERLLNMTYVAYKKCIFREMQFWSHCYTVVSYQALFRLSVYKIPAVYLSGAKNVCFCTMRDFGSPTICICSQPARGMICVNLHLKYKKCSLRKRSHTGKCIRRFGGIYAFCWYFIDRKW